MDYHIYLVCSYDVDFLHHWNPLIPIGVILLQINADVQEDNAMAKKKGQKDKQRCRKHIHRTKDRVT